MKSLPLPCKACPWKVRAQAQDIPAFSIDMAEHLALTCPDSRGYGPDYGAPFFACHQSTEGTEFPCAGWLAVVGHRHPGVRLAILQKRLPADALNPGENWPELHASYAEMMEKLRSADG